MEKIVTAGIIRRMVLLAALAFALLAAGGLAVPGAERAATNTVSCADMALALIDARSVTPTDHADLNTGTCSQVASGTPANYDSGFSLQTYTEGAAQSGAPLWILPSAVIGGVGQRFNSSNPVQCTGAGCGSWPRGDYALCAPTAGACHFSASFLVNGFPASISGDVAAGEFKLTNISVSYEPASIPAPPNVAPVFSGVPSDISVDTDPGLATAAVSFTAPTANDDVDGAVTPVLTAGLPSGSAFPVGVTTVTYTATDSASNSATASFTVTVTDAEKPVIAPIAAITVAADAGTLTAAVPFSASVSDNVDPGAHFTPVFKIGSTTISSGHLFPLGTTTVTVDANDDTAGNTPEQISFDVTVSDDELPVFDTFPSDISLVVDYPQTRATASWTEPTATDNDPGVSVTQTAGLPSGSLFPLGLTTVSYAAEDGAGNIVTRSLGVTVTQRTPGSVTFVVSSSADRTFSFTSAESALNVAVTTHGGGGSSGGILLRPGTYSFGFAGPADIGIASATCSNGAIDVKARTGTVTLASGGAVTCAIAALNSVHDTVTTIGALSQIRGQLIMAYGPDLQRRLDRLSGKTAAGGVSGFGLAYFDEDLPVSLRMGSDTASFAYSLRDARQMPAASSAAALAEAGLASDATEPPLDFDAWLEGKYARFDASGGSGGFGILNGGLDYRFSEDLLVGLGAQLDLTDMHSVGGPGHADGIGLMVGPYATANLLPGLYFDGRAEWGYSYNRISPYGTYSDGAVGQRGLVTAALGGKLDLGAVEIRPEARLSWYREQIGGYTDSLDVDIPAVTVETGELKFGPTVRLPGDAADDVSFIPFASLNGIWTFAQRNSGAVSGPAGPGDGSLRAAVEAGFDLSTAGGLSMAASASYDGIGTRSYRTIGGTLSIGQKF